MKKLFSLLCVLNFLAVSAQESKINYLKLSDPVTFDGKQYFLSASYHPQDAYYRQEYIPKGDDIDRFNTMLDMDLLLGIDDVKIVMQQKEAEIDKAKATDPVAHFVEYENPAQGNIYSIFCWVKLRAIKSALLSGTFIGTSCLRINQAGKE